MIHTSFKKMQKMVSAGQLHSWLPLRANSELANQAKLLFEGAVLTKIVIC